MVILAVPFRHVARNGAEQVGFVAMVFEMRDRLIDQHRRLLARALLAHQRHQSRLSRLGVTFKQVPYQIEGL